MVVLPLPVGPVTRMRPCGSSIHDSKSALLVLVEPQLGDVLHQRLRVEDADDHLLAEGGGQGGDAQLDLPAVPLGLDAPVLRPALLGDVDPRRASSPGETMGGCTPLGSV